MNDRDALLAAILTHPGEDTPRLVLADWLAEFGDESDRQRAAVIRSKFPRGPRLWPMEMSRDWAIASHLRWCLDGTPRFWRHWLCPHPDQPEFAPSVDAPQDWHGWCADRMPRLYGTRQRRGRPLAQLLVALRHGFVSHVGLNQSRFLRHAATLFGRQPIVGVALHDREPYQADRKWYWFASDQRTGGGSGYLRNDLIAHVRGAVPRPGRAARVYDSRRAALDALANAAVSFGRSLAGLTPIPQ